MNRSARRILPASSSSSPSTDALRVAAATPDRPLARRISSRLGFAGPDHGPQDDAIAVSEAKPPGGIEELQGRETPTDRSSALGVRRNSMRRAPVQSIFPDSYDERTASGKVLVRKDSMSSPRAALLRLASLNEMIGEEYLLKLRVLFDICDGNSDGSVTSSELLVLLGLMGMADPDAIEATALNTADEASTTTFDVLTKAFRTAVVTCAACYALPRDDFVLRCKRLKHGFQKIDGDRDQGMTRAELEIATQKLGLGLGDHDLDRIFAVLDRNHDGSAEWSDFVFSAYHNTLAPVTTTMDAYFAIDMFADLPSFIRQVSGGSSALTYTASSQSAPLPTTTPVTLSRDDRRSSKRLVSFVTRRPSMLVHSTSTASSIGRRESVTKSAIERIGIQYLTRTSMEHLAQSKRVATMTSRRFDNETPSSAVVFPGTATRRASTLRTGFSVHVRRRIRVIEATAVCIGALAGIVCGLLSIGFETLLTEDYSTRYYVYLMLINIAVSILEVHGMYATAVIAAFRLTLTTNLKLYPLDAEREFLTRAIARAALQVGHRKDKLFGIDPLKDSPRLVLLMSFMVYKSKRYALKLLLKLLIKRVLWRAAAKSVLSLLVLPLNGVMNAWTLREVMLNCRVSIIGPPSVVSLLETFFLQDDQISPFQRVDYVRILGVSLVCKRCIHPNVEIMIEHMRHQWLKPELWPVTDDCCCLSMTDESCPRHSLDDMDLLLASLRLYASNAHGPTGASVVQHRRNMFLFFTVALIIDGSVDWIERRLFVRLCNAARLQNSWQGVLRVKDDFIAGKGIHMDAVLALIQEIPLDQQGHDDHSLEQRVP